MTQGPTLKAIELNERYEQLRARVTEGAPGSGDGLVALRRHGLHAWVAQVRTAQAQPARPGRALGCDAKVFEHSPLVSLCTDMLIAALLPQES